MLRFPSILRIRTRDTHSARKNERAKSSRHALRPMSDAFEERTMLSGATLSIGGFLVTNVVTTPTPTGTTVQGDATLPLAGSVHLEGTVTGGTQYSLSAPVPSLSAGGFTLANDTATLTNAGLSVVGKANLP